MKITIDHNDVTYNGSIEYISSTFLGFEDHGVFTFNIEFTPNGGSFQGTGHYNLSKGTNILKTVLKTIGADSWEKLKNEKVIVLRKGYFIDGIADLTGEKICIFKEEFANENEN